MRLANATPYGLASGVFTQYLARAHRLVRRIRAGIVWVNTYRAISPIAPFGGYGLSGFGREGGLDAVLDYTRTKSVWLRTTDDPDPRSFRDAMRISASKRTTTVHATDGSMAICSHHLRVGGVGAQHVWRHSH